MYNNIKRLDDLDFSDKKVIMRCDFNVPLDKERSITSTKRIDAALPSIKKVLENCKQLVLMSHLGKPKKLADKGEDFETKLSLDVVAKSLSEKLSEEVILVKDYMNNDLPENKIILLENVRFYYEQEQSKDDKEREVLAKRLASFGEVFVNDAFGTCHRKQASVYDIAKFLPSCIGYLVDKEVTELAKVIEPEKPFVAILGGAKVEDKIQVIEALSKKTDNIIIVGAMDFAFKKAQGLNVGQSLCEGVEVAKEALNSDYADKLILPEDTVVAIKEGFNDVKTIEGDIEDDYAGLDIGDKSIKTILNLCKEAKTIFWNGPAGLFEVPPFNKGTLAIANALSNLTNTRIVGGGDSVTAVEQAGVADKFTHVSTGGGASLELIQHESLPALDIQESKNM